MTRDEDNFLSRWSRKKIAARKGEAVEPAKASPQAKPVAQRAEPAPDAAPAQVPVALPPIDSLTIDSDFSPFLQPGVDPALKQEALKKLVRDPRFNVMDGLDVYIDDYSKPDPMPEEWLGKLNQMKHLGHYLEPEEAEAGIAKGDAQELAKAAEEPSVPPDPVPGDSSTPDAQSRDSG